MIHSIINAIMRRKNQLSHNDSGNIAVEFAFLLPVFIVLTLGVIEFSMWFFETEITTNSMNNISQAVQKNPNITTAQLQQMVNSANYGFARISFYDPVKNANSKNYICVKSYSTVAQAQSGGCAKGNLSAANPSPGSPYAIAINAYVAPNPLTPLGNFIHSIAPSKIGVNQTAVSTVGNILPSNACVNGAGTWAVMQYDPTATPQFSCFQIPIPSITSCNGAGQVLQYSGGANGVYTCVTVTPPPTCNKPWLNLEWDSATAKWNCPKVPYVFAGGIAHAATTNPSAFWADGSSPVHADGSFVPWAIAAYGTAGGTSAPMYRDVICQRITFTVPAGLPAGQIIAQGNLIYPGAGNDGAWKHWTVSFVNLDVGSGPPTTSAYNGSAYACMDNGGNWEPNSANPYVNSEYQSWTIIFIPN